MQRNPQLATLSLWAVLLTTTFTALPASASLQVGWGGHAQRNTLRAIENGMKLFDGVEIDVRATKDGVVIGLHDATLDRETTGTGSVADTNWEDLTSLQTLHGDPLAPLSDMLRVIDAHGGFVFLDVRDVPPALVRQAMDEAEFPHSFAKILALDHGQGSAYIHALPEAEVFFKTYREPSQLDDSVFLDDLIARGYADVGFPTWAAFPSRNLTEKNKDLGLFTFSFHVSSQAEANTASNAGIDYVVSDGNLYHFARSAPSAIHLTNWEITSTSAWFEVKTPRLFRQVSIEKLIELSDPPRGKWQRVPGFKATRIAPGHFRFDLSKEEARNNLYRARLIP